MGEHKVCHLNGNDQPDNNAVDFVPPWKGEHRVSVLRQRPAQHQRRRIQSAYTNLLLNPRWTLEGN